MGLKSYQVTISDGKSSVIVADELIKEKSVKEKVIEVNYPNKEIDGTPLNPKATKFLVSVTATDRSNWGFFRK